MTAKREQAKAEALKVGHYFRPLTRREMKLYQNLRSDRMIRLSAIPALIGMGSAKAITRVLIAEKCPIYRIGIGPYRVFSRDVIEALNGLDIVNNGKWRKQLERLWQEGVRHGLGAPHGIIGISGVPFRKRTREDSERLLRLAAERRAGLRGSGNKVGRGRREAKGK